MPAPGDQYNGGNVQNPYEKPAISGFTAIEVAHLQSKLNKQLGPEYISQRPGNGGGRVAYLEGNKAISLANEVFGFNGWSSSLGNVQIDYVDEFQNGKISLGLSIVVRITLKDGAFHEDIGYGSIENGKGKAASFEKAKKEAATDGLKRALRTFGNVLGNCLYDKEYLKKVQSMKVRPMKFKEEKLHRHTDFAIPQEEQRLARQESHASSILQNQVLRTRTDHLAESFSADFDDDFDGNLFDGVDISEQNGDKISFEKSSNPELSAPKSIDAPPARGWQATKISPVCPEPSRQPGPGIQRQSATRVMPNQGPRRTNPDISRARQPQIAVRQQNHADSKYSCRQTPPHLSDNTVIATSKGPQQQHDSSKTTYQCPQPNVGMGQHMVTQLHPQATTISTDSPQTIVNRPPIGFVTSRAAELLQKEDSAPSFNHLPAFDPHTESPIPKDKRTPGVDHARSIPIKREAVGAQSVPQTSSQTLPRPAAQAGSSLVRPSNFVNPHQDASRRIGMPNMAPYNMSPSANRSAYKPPTFANGGAPQNGLKRDRPALQDISNTGGGGNWDDVNVEDHDAKRQKKEALGVENSINI